MKVEMHDLTNVFHINIVKQHEMFLKLIQRVYYMYTYQCNNYVQYNNGKLWLEFTLIRGWILKCITRS